MEAKELRIGNYLKFLSKIEQVESVIDSDWIRLSKSDLVPINAAGLKPLDITEEWLYKFKFKQHEVTNFYFLEIINDWTRIYFDPYHDICDLSISSHSAVLNKISFVHQLQNLYFALTGEELTINEDNE
ncbi:hypothetical protein ATE47_04090 [Chryseobacterium sp. IHB B 17019]|uniref:hypothetical protein n=1 Tax=Chryseobacterium sp. IHB B 17019 TaxID=1721091 RepID=UPI0007205D27|nr:hypothetical protein [Chryseobacterium sp. IHB B 17019]ALR29750.1 hypothetical protein ATE47_04090 [Chryseobacterium sp. IHB B 17019]